MVTMITPDVGLGAASSFLVISNLFTTLNITKLIIPEVVQKGNSSGVTLDCDYSAVDGDFMLQWLFNGEPVYEWMPSKEPVVKGALEGRLNLSYIYQDPLKQHRALRIVAPDEALSGDYTCALNNTHSEARQSGHMLVFSPQTELSLDWHTVWNSEQQRQQIQIMCRARGVYPQPELVLQRKNMSTDNQHQRVWRSGDGSLYDAETVVDFLAPQLRDAETFTCRLAIPAAGYVAMFDKVIIFRNTTSSSNYDSKGYTHTVPNSLLCIFILIILCR